MSKYTMRDSTGQLWHDVDDSNFSDFMSTYPDAVIIEEIDEETGDGQEVSTIDMPIPEDSVVEEVIEISPDDKYRNKLQKDLSGYDPVKEILIKTYEDLPTESRMKLTDKDAKIAASGNLQNISDQGKETILTNYTFPMGWTGDKDFNGFIEVNKQAKETMGLDQSSEYDSKLNKYNEDLSNALSSVKQGQIPTSVLDGDLGAKIVGHEEEQVYTTLNNLYSDYGFKFEETGIGDNVKVFAPNGQATEISLDNWTNAGDKEQATKLKSFLDLNKGDYNPSNIKKIAAIGSGDLDIAAMEKIAKDEKGEVDFDWVTNVFKDEKVSDEIIKNFDAVYDADIVKEETQKLNNQLVDVNKQYSKNKAAFNTYKLDLQNLQNEIRQGDLSNDEIAERKSLLVKTEQDILATDKRLGDLFSTKIQPLQAQLQIVNAKKYVVEAEKGNIAGITANTILGVGDKITSYFNGGMLALKEEDIKKYWSEDPEQGKKALAREAEMAISKITEKYGADVTNEYEQEFNSTVAGGVYTSMVEMGSMMLVAAATGTGAVGYGALMGLSIAGGEMEEMMGEDFEGLSMKERFGLATTIGVVNGIIEGAGAKFGGIIGGAGAKGVSSVVRKGILGKVMGKLTSKQVSKAAIKKATNEVIEEGIKTGAYALTKAGLKAGTAEALTEALQEVATRKIKQGVNSWKEKEIFDKMATEITMSNITRAGAMGFLAGGPIGVISAGYRASKANAIDKISDAQYKIAKGFTLNKSFQEGYSQDLQLRVMDPNDTMTRDQADTILRDLSSQGATMRELDGMSLTIEGEKKAYTLLRRKKALQKQIDKATDKSIVKKQREDITQINEQLEAISLQYNFESAFEAGLEQAKQATESSGKSFTEFNSSKEFEAKMKDLGEQDDAGFKTTSGYIDGDGNIYINKEGAKTLRDISVGQHELLHGVVGKQLGNVGGETVQQFKDSLSKSELDILQPRIDSSYGGDPTTEEYFNTFVDAVVKGDIKYNENIFTKIGDFITKNLLKPMGFSNAQLGFKDGRQVYNFVKDYAKQSRRIAQGQQEGFEGEVGDIVAEGTEGRASGAKSVQVQGVEPEQVQTMIDKVANRAAAKFFSGIPQNVREEAGLTRRSYIDSAKSELSGIAEKFDASRADFDRYMANTGMQRLNSLATRLGVKSAETQTTRITEDTKQIAAEEDTSKDNRTDREIRQDERKGVKVREKLPKVYDVDKVVKSIRSRAKSSKAKNIKQLKGTALEEISIMIGRDEELGKSIFKKLEKNSDLNKPEMLAIQNFINSNVDVAKGSLLEGYTSEFKATGVVNKLLEKFYNKRSVRAKTGPGLSVQIKKPNISDAEFKEAFGITGKDQANWNQKVVAKKGGVSDILKGFIRNFDQVISSQEIREQLIEDGEPIEATRTLRDGIPSGFFSKNLKDIKNEGDLIKVAELMMSDNFLNNADLMRKTGASDWLYKAFDGLLDKEFIKSIGGGRISQGIILLKKIASDFQLEFDPNNSWQDYIKKSNNIAISEAKLGVRTNLKTIAKAKGIDVDTGTGVVNNLDSLNVLRVEIVQLINELKAEGISDNDISKYIISALTSPARLGGFDLTNDQALTILKDSDVKKHSKVSRLGIFGSVTDKTNQTGIDGERVNSRIYEHGKWFNVAISLEQAKKYGVKKGSSFNDLPLNKRKAFIKNEIQPEGLKAKKVLDTTTKIMVKLFKEGKLSAQTAVSFIEMQFASMSGLGKLASDVRFIPTMTKNEVISLFKDVKSGDTFVLEHTIPGHRIKTLMFNAILSGDKASMDLFEAELEQYHSAIIPKAFDKQVNYKDGKEFLLKVAPGIRTAGDFALNETGRYSNKSRFPISLLDVDNNNVYGQAEQLQETIEESRESNGFESKQSGVQTNIDQNGFFSKTNEDIINDFSKMDKALDLANSLNQPVKKVRVFDFDDTLAYTKSDVLFTSPDGTTGKLNAEEFANQGKELLDQGYKFDFSEFNKVTKGKPGPLLDIAKKINAARGNEDLFVLTARAPEAQQAIYEFLKSQGVEFKKENIIGLGNSTGEAKAQWLVGKAAEGYNDFYFADDAIANVKAVKKAMSVLDVKSKVQQAKGKFSKQMSDDFNRIIEETRGLGREKTYSEARAKQVGSQKGKRKFWIPYSAEDMLGLIYPLLGKGKVGDAQMKWFKENLFNPFSKGMESLSAARVQLMADFKALKKNMDVPKDLQKEAFSGFTNEQAVRMYMWDMQGMEIPGISKRDLKDAKRVINSNEKLRNFAQMLIQINKGDGYPKPSESWLAGTITTDLVDGLNTIKRTKYLEQWQQNVDAIFSKENLNKLEAVHGSNYREALENMLTRMKTGKNRIEGSNRMSDKVLDWINGSVGAIMFFNTRSAVLQLISSINFVNLSDNNLYAAGKAFANQKQYWSDFKMLMNSDFLVDRRNGLKINVSESEIADAAKTSKNKARAVLNYILKKGFLPTQIADSFAIASGGATFYRNRVNTYLKDGMTQKEAESKAFTDFREISEESQQSSRPDKISQQQASSLGRVLLAFANTPMQYGRLTKRAYQDLINGRGDRKSNISKIIYYTAVQNMIFNVLQQAVTMLGFGDDEEDDENKQEKYVDVANGMADSILRGLGIAGSAVSVAKNFLLDLYERSGRTRPEYVDSIYKLLQFSPPISSKISKLRQAAWQFDSKKRRKEIFDKGFALDNPAYEAVGKVVSATTNLPVDRVYNKINNIDAALAEDTETWESVAMLLGWPEWQIKPKPKYKSKKSGYKSDFKKRKNRRNKKVFR